MVVMQQNRGPSLRALEQVISIATNSTSGNGGALLGRGVAHRDIKIMAANMMISRPAHTSKFTLRCAILDGLNERSLPITESGSLPAAFHLWNSRMHFASGTIVQI